MNNSIKNWTEEDRPREKMLQKGAAALTDAELLTILIGSGTRKHSALELSKMILGLANNNLRELGRITVPELQKINGIGEARAITICAALELGRRRQVSEAPERPRIKSSKDAAPILVPLMQDLGHEVFYVLYLNNSHRLVKQECMSVGGMTGTVVDVRLILKNCLLYNANNIIIAHNHPSGNKKPSEADIQLTRKLCEAAKVMDILLLDHLVVAGNEYVSLADEGLF
jgi:DNA repair protein RadC